jgi:hypothetical protein
LGSERASTRLNRKEVHIWSPFTVGTNFPSGIEMQKKKYTRGEIPTRTRVPPVVADIEGGLILDLPDENIAEYIA